MFFLKFPEKLFFSFGFGKQNLWGFFCIRNPGTSLGKNFFCGKKNILKFVGHFCCSRSFLFLFCATSQTRQHIDINIFKTILLTLYTRLDLRKGWRPSQWDKPARSWVDFCQINSQNCPARQCQPVGYEGRWGPDCSCKWGTGKLIVTIYSDSESDKVHTNFFVFSKKCWPLGIIIVIVV